MRSPPKVPFLRVVAMLLVGAALGMPLQRASAQTNVLCFTQPGITNCIGGRFLQYWQQNGGLAVFGYPITAEGPEQTPDGTFTVQYFERERFELQPTNPTPYDVLLGRLGDQLLRRQGVDWTTLPKANPNSPNYFAQTGHSVSFDPFFQYWSSNGLQDPALAPYQRSLALFGLPLTEAYTTTNSSGDTVLTQWFERARFEYHSTNPDPFKVLLGLLGTEWRSAPPAPQQSITITSPAPGATVGNPFTVTGTTTIVPNGSILGYGVYDANSNLIGQGTFGVVPTSSGSQFSATISFNPPPNAAPISLMIIEPGTGGRPPIATARVNLQYAGAPQSQSIRIDEPTRDQVYNSSPIRARGATTVFPQRGQLHFVIYRAGGSKVGEGDFPVSQNGSGSSFDHTLNFTAPNVATYLELELSDRDNSGNTIATSSIRVYFDPGGNPPPPQQQVITINTPAPGTTVGRTFQAEGFTSLYPPGGTLNYGVLDTTGQLIGQGSIGVVPSGSGGAWAAEISFTGGSNGTPISLDVLQPGGGPGEPPVARTTIQLQCCLVGQ